MSLKHSNGCYAAIFLILSFSSCLSMAQPLFSYSAISASNHGVLTKDFWASQKVDVKPATAISFKDVSLRSSWPVKEQVMFVERNILQTYVGGVNALSLAATDSFNTKSQVSGQYPIGVKIQQFEWDALGLSLKGKNDFLQDFSWKVEPKVAKLRQFKSGSGEALLNIEPNNSSLNGTLHRESSSSYGYLINPSQFDIGYGVSADIFFKLDLGPAVSLTLDVKNLWSHFSVRGAFVSDRKYQIVQTEGEIKFSNVPSISGTYGQINNSYRVPIIYQLGLSKDAQLSYGAGVLGFDREHMLWAKVGYKTGLNHFDLTTYAFDNFAVSYRRDDLFTKGLSVGFVLLSGFSGKPTLHLQTVIYDF